jgi:hypothetical protein
MDQGLVRDKVPRTTSAWAYAAPLVRIQTPVGGAHQDAAHNEGLLKGDEGPPHLARCRLCYVHRGTMHRLESQEEAHIDRHHHRPSAYVLLFAHQFEEERLSRPISASNRSAAMRTAVLAHFAGRKQQNTEGVLNLSARYTGTVGEACSSCE